jgi:hypothetical protein
MAKNGKYVDNVLCRQLKELPKMANSFPKIYILIGIRGNISRNSRDNDKLKG